MHGIPFGLVTLILLSLIEALSRLLMRAWLDLFFARVKKNEECP